MRFACYCFVQSVTGFTDGERETRILPNVSKPGVQFAKDWTFSLRLRTQAREHPVGYNHDARVHKDKYNQGPFNPWYGNCSCDKSPASHFGFDDMIK